MLKKFTEHPAEQNETYIEHMLAAWRIVYELKVMELKVLVHSFFPFLYTTAVSDKIECLKLMTSRNNKASENDR